MIGAPVERYATFQLAQAGTTVLSPSSRVVQGRTAVLCATSQSGKVLTAVADDVGNSWLVDKTATDTNRAVSFASCYVISPIETSSVVTLTWSVATSGAAEMWIQEVPGLVAVAPFDTFKAANGSGTDVSTGATPVLAQAEEIAFGAFRINTTTGTWTKGAAFTDPTTPKIVSTAVGQASLEYAIVASGAPVTADGTFSVSGSWQGLVVTYKGIGVEGAAFPGSRRIRSRATSW